MKRIAIGALLVLLMVTPAFAWEWKTIQKSYTTLGTNQEVLAVGSAYYCVVEQVEIVNYGLTDTVIKLHWEGAASETNRICPEFTAEAECGGRIYDKLWVMSDTKGQDIDIDLSASTTSVKVWIKYMLTPVKISPR